MDEKQVFDKLYGQYNKGLITGRELVEELTVVWNQIHSEPNHCLGCAS